MGIAHELVKNKTTTEIEGILNDFFNEYERPVFPLAGETNLYGGTFVFVDGSVLREDPNTFGFVASMTESIFDCAFMRELRAYITRDGMPSDDMASLYFRFTSGY